MRMVPNPLISTFNLSKPPSYLHPGFSSTPCAPICICFDLPLGHSYWPHLHNGLCQPRTWSVALGGWMLGQKIAARVVGRRFRAEEAKAWSQSWYSVVGLGVRTGVTGCGRWTGNEMAGQCLTVLELARFCSQFECRGLISMAGSSGLIHWSCLTMHCPTFKTQIKSQQESKPPACEKVLLLDQALLLLVSKREGGKSITPSIRAAINLYLSQWTNAQDANRGLCLYYRYIVKIKWNNVHDTDLKRKSLIP